MSGSGFHGAAFQPRGSRLGQAASDAASKAKGALAAYDGLWERTQKVNDQASRELLAGKFHSKPEDPESVLYARNAVAYQVTASESVSPPNYTLLSVEPSLGQVGRLEAAVAEWGTLIAQAEEQYGVLAQPEPVTPSQASTIEVPKSSVALEVGLAVAAVIGAVVFGLVLD